MKKILVHKENKEYKLRIIKKFKDESGITMYSVSFIGPKDCIPKHVEDVVTQEYIEKNYDEPIRRR